MNVGTGERPVAEQICLVGTDLQTAEQGRLRLVRTHGYRYDRIAVLPEGYGPLHGIFRIRVQYRRDTGPDEASVLIHIYKCGIWHLFHGDRELHLTTMLPGLRIHPGSILSFTARISSTPLSPYIIRT